MNGVNKRMKVFIADDEGNVREGLKKIIDWGELGYQICGEASNGSDCLEGIMNLSPDLVLLDIRMPKMHGLEVVKKAREEGFNGKVIIISGYSDFTYAQSAIQYGVEYYLLKPIDEEELEKAVIQIYKDLQEEQRERKNTKEYIAKAKYSVLRDIIQGKTYDNKNSASFFDIVELMKLKADCYQIVIVECYNNKELNDCNTLLRLLKVPIEKIEFFLEYIQIHKRNVILLKGNNMIHRFSNLIKSMEQDNNSFEKENIFLAVGRTVTKLEDITLSYEDAKYLLNRKFFCKKQQYVVTKSDLIESNQDHVLDELKGQIYFDLIYNGIETYNRNGIKDALLQMQNEVLLSGAGEELVKSFLIGIFIRIKHHVLQDYRKCEISFENNADIIHNFQKMGYLYEIMSYIELQLFYIIKEIGNSSSDSILADIMYYIDQNYKKNLKLESIALIFGYNSAYLGKIFTKSMGENFNSYVDKVRINYAKELLLQDKLKVYEIAENVGYKNLDYFHKKFKKYVGFSPAEYRKQKIEKGL